MKLRLDSFGTSLLVLAVMIDLYLATIINVGRILYPSILLLSGVVFLKYYTPLKLDARNVSEGNLLYYSLVALGFTGAIGLVVPQLFQHQSVLDLAGDTRALFLVLMAVAEEVFFRGFLYGFFVDRLHSLWLGNFIQALLWAVYHTAVYGSMQGVLLYILLVGLVYGWADARTQSLTPGMFSHVIVNLMVGV